MLWLMAAGETPSLRAASERLPFSAVVMKTINAFKVSMRCGFHGVAGPPLAPSGIVRHGCQGLTKLSGNSLKRLHHSLKTMKIEMNCAISRPAGSDCAKLAP